jgi:trehalose 6-phosphate phosphatase
LILAEEQIPILANFAWSNVLLAFDYDGTLSPIAATPEQARMRRSTRELLAIAASLYPCVVISGRALDDIAQRLSGIPVWHVFGNHGLESTSSRAQPTAQSRVWVERLTHVLACHAGVVVEDKGPTVTIHYRGAADRPQAVAAIAAAVRGLPGARIVGGNEAINLLPFRGGDKGAALRQALTLFMCHTAVYVGDDATDEDAFHCAPSDQLLGIRVGAMSQSAARYHVESQDDIDRLLEMLIDLRRRR